MYDDLVLIQTYFQVIDAQLAKSKLDAYDVFCFLKDENLVQNDWLRTIAYGGVKLYVRAEDKARAEEILNDVQAD
ncbi:MAG TPA: DUF2007 domain-containing protein [Chitinophagales bacterium]|nr:DUF2007 domain-containing protein [Chitinophagales bacterium]